MTNNDWGSSQEEEEKSVDGSNSSGASYFMLRGLLALSQWLKDTIFNFCILNLCSF